MSSNHRTAARVAASLAVLVTAGGCAARGPAPAPVPVRPAVFAPLGGNRAAAVEVLGGRLDAGAPTVERQLHDGIVFTLAISPARPGWNLVRVDATPTSHAGHDAHEEHGRRLLVGTDPAHLVAATSRPGTDGSWARLRLPAGGHMVYVAHGPDHRLPFPVDTGSGPAPRTPANLAGPDGPECLAGSVGALLAGASASEVADAACPSDALSDQDGAALRGVVDTLASRGAHGLALLADDSPRSRTAARVVRREAAARDLRVTGPEQAPAHSAFVSVAGWSRSATALAGSARAQQRQVRYEHGAWLAPWLLTPGVVDSTPGAVLPMGFDVRDPEATRFQAALGRLLPGTAPTASGFAAWASTRGHGTAEAASLYAASRASAMAMGPTTGESHADHETTLAWFPGGTVTRVSGPLT